MRIVTRRAIDMTIDEKIAKEKANAEKLRKIIETGYDGEISIEALFCDDTSAIKEAYERFENCAKEHEQLAEWMEELKFLRQWKSDVMDEFCKYDCNSVEEARNNGYNKAIDDFVNACKENILCQTFGLHINGIERIAEQLKAGGENENYNKEES